jgi:hypothetical protein
VLPLLLLCHESRTELRQEAIAPDPPQARFDVEQRGGNPVLLLLAGYPPIDLCPVRWPTCARSASMQFVAFKLSPS